jgi:chemotaxis methyl-accepting protein methylase
MAKSAAQASKEYRERQKMKYEALGVKQISIDVAAGVEARLAQLMVDHGFEQFEELFQTLTLNLSTAPDDLVASMLKRPDASSFQVKTKHARQLREFAESGGIDARQ